MVEKYGLKASWKKAASSVLPYLYLSLGISIPKRPPEADDFPQGVTGFKMSCEHFETARGVKPLWKLANEVSLT